MTASQPRQKPGRPRHTEWKRLRRAIESRDWTQKDAAAFFGITQPTISSWEQGKTAPKFAHWPALAPFVGMSVPELGAEIGVIFFTLVEKDIFYNSNLSET